MAELGKDQCNGRWLTTIMEPAKRRLLITNAVRPSETEEALGMAARLLRSAPPLEG